MTKRGYENQVVWIVGASSGIGLSLARDLSARGAILALSARRKDDLERIAAELGPQHRVFALDVTNADAVMRTAQAIRAAFGRIDRVIYLAAAYVPMKMDSLDIAVSGEIVSVNLMGAFNLVHAVFPILKEQPENSQIALCGSVAGYIGLPKGQPYSATKAAIINLAETLRAECDNHIDVKLISPGFVRTPLTEKNEFTMPALMEAEQAASAIADGLLSRRFEIHFPKALTVPMKMLRALPYGLSLRLMRMIKT
ncbi:SDR family NAD(P)-dependent oxidoreductase [Micavibrio aeruginosavorus]|uniref:Oxidoreductase, short-chain dehydrogenase/reductase family n=1 Tax=Micavibrio aeruginosavorus EPB TaxID=349215 RepID=M4VZT5_9BACT|nr:SDR family NAD(P)-dependent oxidoreductase [Micavibrio aeruginosavorus]AGH98704.1 Oxidoreductase, short-chain dehydrogenase/reductase family [Micavibrio aeruginosavorus EPB]